jgi:hypothetical protein
LPHAHPQNFARIKVEFSDPSQIAYLEPIFPRDNARRSQQLRGRIAAYAASHPPELPAKTSRTLINARRTQQKWCFAMPPEITGIIAALDVTPRMRRSLMETALRIGELLFAERSNGDLDTRQVNEHLCSGPRAMSRDCRRRHLNMLEDAEAITRAAGRLHLTGYRDANPTAQMAEARHQARRSQCNAAGEAYRARRKALFKASPHQKTLMNRDVTDSAITPITSSRWLATGKQAQAIAKRYPMFADLNPASVRTARLDRDALNSAAEHLSSSPRGRLNNPSGALIDRARRMERKTLRGRQADGLHRP